MVTRKLRETAIHIPAMPRVVFERIHERGTLTSQSDRREKTMVIIVWPAPFITPLDMNIIPKKT